MNTIFSGPIYDRNMIICAVNDINFLVDSFTICMTFIINVRQFQIIVTHFLYTNTSVKLLFFLMHVSGFQRSRLNLYDRIIIFSIINFQYITNFVITKPIDIFFRNIGRFDDRIFTISVRFIIFSCVIDMTIVMSFNFNVFDIALINNVLYHITTTTI